MSIWTITVTPLSHFSLVTELFLQVNSCLKDKINKIRKNGARERGEMWRIKAALACPLPPIQPTRHTVLVPLSLMFCEICAQRPSALSPMFLTLSLTYPGHAFLPLLTTQLLQTTANFKLYYQSKNLRQRIPSHCLSQDFQIKNHRASLTRVFSRFAEL